MVEAGSQAELVRLTGYSKAYICRLVKNAWFPAGPPWDLAEVLDALQQHSQPKASVLRSIRKALRAAGAVRRPAEKTEGLPQELLDGMRDLAATPLELAEVSLRALGWRLADQLERGLVSGSDATSLRDALKEVRTATLAQRKADEDAGRLIPREAALAVGGELARWSTGLVERVVDSLCPQVVVWVGDPEFQGVGSEKQQAQVRAWAEGLVREERQRVHDELERMLDGHAAAARKAAARGAS